jgi:hypothetical protein
LRKLLLEEEIKTKQRARERYITEGDENTKYFHLKANFYRRRIRIEALMDNDRAVEDEEEKNRIATKFYRNLFGPSHSSSICMEGVNMDRISNEDKILLTAPFTENEIELVVHTFKQNSFLVLMDFLHNSSNVFGTLSRMII